MKKWNRKSVAEILIERAHSEQKAFTFIESGGKKRTDLSYRELHNAALMIGKELQKTQKPGSRVLLLYASSREFIKAFMACHYAGLVAVPAYPPHPKLMNRMLPRILTVIRESDANIVLSDSSVFSDMKVVRDEIQELGNKIWIKTDELLNGPELDVNPDNFSFEKLALIQFTSGSTGNPKGVMISHQNLSHNCSIIQRTDSSEKDIGVSWTPIYHDMGLIFGLMFPLYTGFPMTLMSPLDFLMKPIRWIQELSELKATVTSAPNFAYELCARKVTEEQLKSLDLTALTMANVGAEPVRADSLQKFSDKFRVCGFNSKAFHPAYGMAEATLVISSEGSRLQPPVVLELNKAAIEENKVVLDTSGNSQKLTLVGAGKPMFEMMVEIVDPQTMNRLSEGQVGEIWVSGPSVAQGYWNLPEETKRDFQAIIANTGQGPFLRTGDLGFKKDGELFITGRIKDMIIIHGKNYYPNDIELSVEMAHAPVRPGCVAAFSIEVHGEEKVIVVAEVERRFKLSDSANIAKTVQLRVRSILPGFDPNTPIEFNEAEAAQNIRKNVRELSDVALHALVLIEAGSLPKTSSGKVQRLATKDAFLKNQLKVVHYWSADEIEIKAA